MMEILEAVFLIGALIVSVVAHEVAHGYAAVALGDPTPALHGRLTMNPLAHVDPVGSVLLPAALVVAQSPMVFGWARPVPYSPHLLRVRWGEALVAAAGPATNLLIALVFALVIRVDVLSGAAAVLATQVVLINVLLALFNLVPIPPLDGAKVLRWLLPHALARHWNRFEATVEALGPIGVVAALVVLVLVVSEPLFALVRFLTLLLVGVPLHG